MKPHKCKECQFEDGQHSQECSKYKEQNWEEELSKILLNHLKYYGFETALYRNRPPEEYDHYPYPEFSQITEFISQLLEEKTERTYKEGSDIIKDLPMGVSQWRNHGEKYGYDKFWEKRMKQEMVEKIKRYWGQSVDKDGKITYHNNPTIACIDDIITLINN